MPPPHPLPPTPRPIYAAGFVPPKVPHNDGTLRITIRWNPTEYATLKRVSGTDWLTKVTDTLHFLLYSAPDCKLHRWDPKISHTPLSLIELTPDNLMDYLSPTITEIDSKDLYVFAIRVSMCSGGSPGPWIKHQTTQATLFKHRLDVRIYNASSDSGDIEIAGYILLKDPTMTHRIQFADHLRHRPPPSVPSRL